MAIKGIVFDVSRNSAYGPTGQYRGMSMSCSPRTRHGRKLTKLATTSLCRKGSLACPGQFVAEARRLQTRLARPRRQGEDGTGGVVYVLQQAVQHRWQGRGSFELLGGLVRIIRYTQWSGSDGSSKYGVYCRMNGKMQCFLSVLAPDIITLYSVQP